MSSIEIIVYLISNKRIGGIELQELSLDKEILKKDYEEIIKYISETYNLNIHEISFTLLINQTKKLIRFEIKLDKYLKSF